MAENTIHEPNVMTEDDRNLKEASQQFQQEMR